MTGWVRLDRPSQTLHLPLYSTAERCATGKNTELLLSVLPVYRHHPRTYSLFRLRTACGYRELLSGGHHVHHSRRSLRSTVVGRSNRRSANGNSRCAASAGSSRGGRSRTWPGVCLDRRIPALERHRICVGGRKMGSSPTCRGRLGVSTLRSKRRRLGIPQRILALTRSN